MGTVTSSPAGISCGTGGTACVQSYDSGTQVTLTAAAATGYVFTGWSGACSGTGACSVTLSSSKTVTPSFTALTQTCSQLDAFNSSLADVYYYFQACVNQ